MALVISALFSFATSSLIPLPHHDMHFTIDHLNQRITWYAQDHFTNHCYHPCKVKNVSKQIINYRTLGSFGKTMWQPFDIALTVGSEGSAVLASRRSFTYTDVLLNL